ncbi:TIGR00269 family protein [Candidatus Bathyarchaeota archaeon]|nr:MAG: TIGR00269 family protein [Candidatus Bathyarchaeota archaeon]
MFEFDDTIAVALSGGKDSASLLHILWMIEDKFPKSTLIAVTVDEGIKGYRDEALKIAAENCRTLNIEHKKVSFKELYGYTLDEIVRLIKEKGGSLTPCAVCGVLRRRALNYIAREVGADKLATAHNLDDEVQTLLINILHGDPYRIARVKPVSDLLTRDFVRRVKPLCEIPERETALYAYLKGIRFQDLPCPYAGEALRNDVRNMLNRLEEKHPGIKFTIYRSFERLRPFVETATKNVKIGRCSICGEPSVSDVCQVCEILKSLT